MRRPQPDLRGANPWVLPGHCRGAPGRKSAGALPGRKCPGSAPAVPRRYLRSGNPLRRSKKALESGRAHRRARAGAITRAGKIAPRRLAAGARSMVLLAKLSHAQTSVAQRTRWHDARSASGRAAPCKTCSRGRPRAATSWCSRCHTRYRQVPLRLARPARSSDSERWRETVARALLARSCDVHGARRKPQRLRTSGRRLIRSTPSRSACSSTSQRS